MKKRMVYIIGGDHHNTLAVIRSFGKNKVPFKLLIHSNDIHRKPVISFSKYIKEYDIISEDDKMIYEWLLSNKIKDKIVLFPCSDLAEYVIDNNYISLCKNYIIPGFKDKPGKVVELMDKKKQNDFALKNNIKCAKSWLLSLNSKMDTNQIPFPCIVKPNISAHGKKSDIIICYKKDELEKSLKTFKNNGYTDAIVQEFINKQYEVCAFGCILTGNIKNRGCILKKIRENPPRGGGSLTFAKIINDQQITSFVDKIISLLYNEEYCGLYDIELLICEDSIYLNEINFRHSGNGYASIDYGIDAPYIWYMNVCGTYIDSAEHQKNNFYLMDESGELKLLKHKYISIFQFIGDLFKTKSFARFKLTDIKVSLAYLKNKR